MIMAQENRFSLAQIPRFDEEADTGSFINLQSKDSCKSRQIENTLTGTSKMWLRQDGKGCYVWVGRSWGSGKLIDCKRFLSFSHRILVPTQNWASHGCSGT